jgi:hypothetical protein
MAAAPSPPHRIFVGYDEREDIAYQVCAHSIRSRAAAPVEVSPIKLDDLRARKLFWRDEDPLQSTQFTYSRFLTPWLARFQGWALFCDCDILFTADIGELFALADGTKAVMCVKHDYTPPEATKMDGKAQTVYPRKNWSSLVLYNCGHPANRVLTPELVNRETGAFLHRFQWLDDGLIGGLPERWNWLEGWSTRGGSAPMAIHYTRGGPWFDLSHPIDYGELWLAERDSYLAARRRA